IPAAEDQSEAVAGSELLFCMAGHLGNGIGGRNPVYGHEQGAADQQNRGGEQLKLIGGCLEHPYQSLGALGPQPGAQTAAPSYHREEPLSLTLRVDVIGEGPDLAHDENVEDPDPDVEYYALLKTANARNIEHPQVDDEENQQTDNQLDPAHLGASESVQGN